jgi:hypothetical protein
MLTHKDLKKLAAVSGPCLTIFQPLRDDYSEVGKPVTRIVAAVQEAERLLTERGFDPAERDEMLRPLLKVAKNTDWTGRKGSLVMFRSPGFTLANFWPDTLASRVHFAQDRAAILSMESGAEAAEQTAKGNCGKNMRSLGNLRP